MKTFLLNSFMFCCLCVTAQKENPVEKESENFRILKLQKYPNIDFPVTTIPISGIQVIQMVRDSVRIGYAMQGISRYIVTLKPAKPLTQFLQEHIISMFKQGFKKEGVRILWVIKELRVGEKAETMQYAYTRFNTDAYISNDGNLFKKVCSIDTVFVADYGVDISIGHGANIEKALKEILKRTLLYGQDVLDQKGDEMTVTQIANDSKPQLDIPILTDQSYKEGAYKNFDEFLQNKPSITDYELVVNADKRVGFEIVGPDNQKHKLEVWGFCKNGGISKCYNNRLVSIKKLGNGFIISDYVEKVTKRNSKIFNAGLLGGAVGGIAGALISLDAINLAEKIQSVNSYPYIEEAAKKPDATCIDMKTGEFSF